jgi:hypothetical protein
MYLWRVLFDMRTSVDQLLESKVLRVPFSTCWYYTGTLNNRGYGLIDVNRKKMSAHRVALSNALGRPLQGQANHICDEPTCINPSHLYEGTQSDNIQDAIRRNRHSNQNVHRTECKRGHRFTVENTYVLNGKRVCRECKATLQRARRAAAQRAV